MFDVNKMGDALLEITKGVIGNYILKRDVRLSAAANDALTAEISVGGHSIIVKYPNVIIQGIPYKVCPSCDLAHCNRDCDGSQGLDLDVDGKDLESDEDLEKRFKRNRLVDVIHSMVVIHAKLGHPVKDVEAALNQYWNENA